MAYVGMIKLSSNLTVYCNTHTPSTGAAVAADAVPGFRVYEDLTTAPLLTGSFAAHDGANCTGFYSAQLAITTANGFEAGKSYCIRITGVVGGVTGVDILQFDVTTVALDDLVRSTTPANALDVSSTGEAGLDFANIKAATGATTLTNITVPTVTSAGLADDAITSAKFDESTAFPVKATDTGATQIARVGADGDTLETLSDQLDGAEPADIWTYATRTLTQSAASLAATVAADDITAHRGDTLVAALTGLGDFASTWVKVYWTAKTNKGDADTAAILQVLLSNPASGTTDGLLYINGEAATTKTNALLTMVNATTGALTITVAAAELAKLDEVAGLYYDVQVIRSTGVLVQTMGEGTFNVSADVTRTVS